MRIVRVATVGVAAAAMMLTAVQAAPATPRHPKTTGYNSIAMVEQTSEAGLWDPLLGKFMHTSAVGDVNGDGWPDMFAGGFYKELEWDAFFRDGMDTRGATEIAPDRMLLGGPDGFEVDPSFPGLRDGNTSASAFGDLDGDGDLDLLVSQYYTYERPSPDGQQVVVLRNDAGKFTRIGEFAHGIGARTLAVADYDGDGNLDFFVTEDRYYESVLGPASSRLLRGDGDLGFTDVTAESGLPGDISGLAATAADLNGDHWPDLFVSGTRRGTDIPQSPGTYERARLFINDGDGTFTEGDAGVFLMDSLLWRDESGSVAAGDLNRDGRQDLVIGAHHYPGLQSGMPQPIDIYLNEGNDENGLPRFRDVTAEAGFERIDNSSPRHVTLADMDNDGWLDIVTGVSVEDGTKPAVFRHKGLTDDGVPTFQPPYGLKRDERTTPPEQSEFEKVGRFRSWPNGSTADFNRDGLVDMFVNEWWPNLPSRYWANQTETSNHWVSIDVGPKANALGATVNVYRPGDRARGRGPIFSRQVLSTESYGCGALHTQHAGIGRDRVVEIEVIGPAPGHARVIRFARAGQTLRIDLTE